MRGALAGVPYTSLWEDSILYGQTTILLIMHVHRIRYHAIICRRYVCVPVCICVYICTVYTCVYIHMYAYMYIYIYMYIYRERYI